MISKNFNLQIPANKKENFIFINGSWNNTIDITFTNEEPIFLYNLYIIFQQYLSTPYPYLIQILSITKDLKSYDDTKNDFYIYEVHSAASLNKINFYMFRSWYLNCWNRHLGYKNQYLSVGFRLIFSCKNECYDKELLLEYPWNDAILNKYDVSKDDLLILF